MNKFIKSLLSPDDEVSSKRVIAIVVLINIIVMAWVAIYYDDKHVVPEFIFDALAMITGGGLGLSVIEKIFTKYNKNKEQ
jgi:hypothetical protein